MGEIKEYKKRKKISNLGEGKLPPQAIDLEEAVLGALLLESQALRQVRNILHPKVFYKESNQKIFQAIIDLEVESAPIDILTLSQKLMSKGELDLVGGPYAITTLTNSVASAANIEHHAMIILQKFTKREHIRMGSDMVTQGYDETIDPLDTNQAVSIMANDLLNSINTNVEVTNLELVKEATQKIQDAKNQKGVTGIPTGFHELDDVTCGLQNGDLIIVAARPGMGKTAFSLSMAKNMAVEHETPGAVFSLEMTSIQLMNRLISSETEIPLKKLQTGDLTDLEWKQYHEKVTPLINEKLTIIDRTKNVHRIKSKMLELHSKGKLKWAVIDYLQIATYPEFKKNREREVSEMSAMFKDLALDLNIPIILLSQLSREVEKRSTKRPQLSDLRDSGSIEQDADIIMFLFRPSYYKMSGAPENQALGIIAKNRNGELKTINFKFDGPTVTYKDWEAKSFDSPAVDSINNDNDCPFK
jgi:replicative DNA helicase